MSTKSLIKTLVLSAALVAVAQAGARAADALSGQVLSPQGKAMEGVLVTAGADTSPIRITVVSDAQGRYAFPADRLGAGRYTLSIRAIGYDLAGPASAKVAAGATAHVDLKLAKTRNLEAQLTNADWLASVPDSPQRRQLTNCTSCHVLSRILESKHTSADFMRLVPMMNRFGAMSTPTHPQVAPNRNPTSEPKGDVLRLFTDYLASVDLSGGPTRAYPLTYAARPSGRATRVIVTEYRLPDPSLTEPHDVVVDRDGVVWYSSFGEESVGRLDPDTGKVTEYPLPLLKPGAPTGSLNLELDAQGNPWLAMMYQPAVAKLDKKTGKVEVYRLPAKFVNSGVQIGMVDPHHAGVDSEVWIQDAGIRWFLKLNLTTGKIDQLHQPKDFPKGAHSPYGMASDDQNNLWFFDYGSQNVGEVDAKTGATVLYGTPTPSSRPRRGHMDGRGHIAFAEFGADKVGVFDLKTKVIREWPTPSNFAPYDAVLDKNGELWTGGMNADRVLRINTKTGEETAYLLPRETNIRRVFVDNSTNPVTFWAGSNHGGEIIKLQPLD